MHINDPTGGQSTEAGRSAHLGRHHSLTPEHAQSDLHIFLSPGGTAFYFVVITKPNEACPRPNRPMVSAYRTLADVLDDPGRTEEAAALRQQLDEPGTRWVGHRSGMKKKPVARRAHQDAHRRLAARGARDRRAGRGRRVAARVVAAVG